MAQALKARLVSRMDDADIHLIFGSSVSKEDQESIREPGKTIVIAGTPSPDAEAFVRYALEKGVAEKYIFFAGSEGIDAAALKSIASNLMQSNINKTRTIAFFSLKGGVGRTTLAAGLVGYYRDQGETAVLVDMSWNANGRYHLTASKYEEAVIPGASMPSNLQWSYRRIVFDTSDLEQARSCDRMVVVVDADVIQCIEPTSIFLEHKGCLPDLVVYNRKKPQVPVELVEACWPSIPVIAVDEDFAGCTTALAAGLPAYIKSKSIENCVMRLLYCLENADGKGICG